MITPGEVHSKQRLQRLHEDLMDSVDPSADDFSYTGMTINAVNVRQKQAFLEYQEAITMAEVVDNLRVLRGELLSVHEDIANLTS